MREPQRGACPVFPQSTVNAISLLLDPKSRKWWLEIAKLNQWHVGIQLSPGLLRCAPRARAHARAVTPFHNALRRCSVMLQLTASLSLGLALMNMTPVKALDGEKCVKPFLYLVGQYFRRPEEDEPISPPSMIVLDAAEGTYSVVPINPQSIDSEHFGPHLYSRRVERIHTIIVQGSTALLFANIMLSFARVLW